MEEHNSRRRSSREDLRERWHQELPNEFAALFDALWQQVASVHASWAIFRQLFLAEPARLKLIKDAAVGVFSVVRQALRNEVIISVSRLLDPAETRNKKNASLAALAEAVRKSGGDSLAEELHQQMSALRAKAAPLLERRNRGLAHSDLPTALLTHPDPLPGISAELLEQVLEEVRAVMNRVEIRYLKSETRYQNPVQAGDGNALLVALEAAVKWENHERARHGLPPLS